jgi:hypothetical protein
MHEGDHPLNKGSMHEGIPPLNYPHACYSYLLVDVVRPVASAPLNRLLFEAPFLRPHSSSSVRVPADSNGQAQQLNAATARACARACGCVVSPASAPSRRPRRAVVAGRRSRKPPAARRRPWVSSDSAGLHVRSDLEPAVSRIAGSSFKIPGKL